MQLLNPYVTKQSFGKAVARSKKNAVVAGLASYVGLNLEGKMTCSVRWIQGLSNNTKEAVKDFYYQPDISHIMPGINDIITIWTEFWKQKLGKFYLTMFLRGTYLIYNEIHSKNSDNGVSYSTFCDLHPKNVLLLQDSPKNQSSKFSFWQKNLQY